MLSLSTKLSATKLRPASGVRIVAIGVILLTSKNRFRGQRRDIRAITREYGGGFFSGETGGEERERGRPEGRVSRKPANVISSTFYWRETDFKALSHLDLIARPRYTVGRTSWLGRREKRKVKGR